MALSSRESMNLTLYEYVMSVKDKVEKSPELKVAYQIPIGIAKRSMERTFSGIKVKLLLDIYTLLKIYDICSKYLVFIMMK
jgi:hypothetical protein